MSANYLPTTVSPAIADENRQRLKRSSVDMTFDARIPAELAARLRDPVETLRDYGYIDENAFNLVASPIFQIELKRSLEEHVLGLSFRQRAKLMGPDALEEAYSMMTDVDVSPAVRLESAKWVAKMGALFRERGILFLVDTAQSAAHMPIDAQKIGCDFLVFSGHKMGGPTGIGVLYGREELLARMPPFLYGGGMIREVSLEQTEFAELPAKFEAGTPNVSGTVGLAAAVEYIKRIGFDEIKRIDEELTVEIFSRLGNIKGMKIFGPGFTQNAMRQPSLAPTLRAESHSEMTGALRSTLSQRGGVVSFTIDGIHPHDLATLLDREGICIRAGHHCAMPLMRYLGVPATSRASFWVYNTKEDIECLAEGVEKAAQLLKEA